MGFAIVVNRRHLIYSAQIMLAKHYLQSQIIDYLFNYHITAFHLLSHDVFCLLQDLYALFLTLFVVNNYI